MKREDLIFIPIALISLWGTVGNVVPVSIAFGIFFPLIPYCIYRIISDRDVRPVNGPLLLMAAYFFISTLIYYPMSFLDPEFYRRDGNFFVTFLPVILFGALRFETNVESVVSKYLLWSSLVNLTCLIAYLFNVKLPWGDESVYHSLFIAHNAAGGYFATISALCLGYLIQTRKPYYLSLLGINIVALYLSDSRGSILGLLFALAISMLLRENHVKKLMVATAIAFTILLSYTHPIWVDLGKGVGEFSVDGVSIGIEREHTIINRSFYLWPRAVDLAISSPLVGTGFGSFNDYPYQLEGIENLVAFNMPTDVVFSDGHAHNTFLHVLGETGFLGLGLLLVFLGTTRRFLLNLSSISLRLGMAMVLWTAIWSSFTEHRLFTPSQMLPFTIILGLLLAQRNYGLAHRVQNDNSVPVEDQSNLQLAPAATP